MYLGIKKVKVLKDHNLLLTFENNEKRIFNMTSYLNKGIFKDLKKEDLFNTVHISFDTIEWENGADMDPEFLYKNSKEYAESFS